MSMSSRQFGWTRMRVLLLTKRKQRQRRRLSEGRGVHERRRGCWRERVGCL